MPPRGSRGACASDARVVIEAAIMRGYKDWVEVSVPRCNTVTPGADEFRLIRFERRWRFVSIALFEEPAAFSAER